MHIAHLFPLTGNLLVCGPNWLGDSIMSMPAIQSLRRRRPSCRITLLVKPKMEDLWRMHPAVADVVTMREGIGGLRRTVGTVGMGKFDASLIFPNSFRSALVPYLARVPVRAGMRGHWRDWMLTHVVDAPGEPARRHQQWEYLEIAGMADETAEPEAPHLSVPDTIVAGTRERLAAAGKGVWVGLIPGAARGPSKQWPPEHFIETGRGLTSKSGCRILILGTSSEAELCGRVAEGIGRAALNVAGETTLAEFAALLEQCRVVVANDSGGMHLAAAVGTPVVALYGLTDPGKTGPLGAGHRVIRHDESGPSARDIARDSSEARDALRAIAPEIVCRSVLEQLTN